MLCLNVFPAHVYKWIDPKEFGKNKYTSNKSKNCVFEVNLVYLKKLWELHNGYPLPPDKREIKKEILSKYR